jgi:hypothetical protein
VITDIFSLILLTTFYRNILFLFAFSSNNFNLLAPQIGFIHY